MLARKLFLGVFVAVIIAVVSYGLPEAQKKIGQGDVAVDFSLPDLQGKMQSLGKGDAILLNFWATWCPPCRQEMPSMIALSNKYAGKGLKVVAVSVDRDKDQLEKFVKKYKLPFRVLHDADSSISKRYGVFRYPETFLIDREGKVQAHLIGAVEWMTQPMQKNIELLLQGKSFTVQ